MTREAIVLVLAMAAGTVLSAACDSQEQRTVVVPPPPASNANSNPNSGSNVALGTPTAEERKSPPVQGEVDTKEPAQRQDFEQKK